MKYYSDLGYEDNVTVKYVFESSNQIHTSYSQVLQDIFVLSVLDGKRQGKYFEIGAGNPDFISNTKLLTSSYDWAGVSIDCVEEYQTSWRNKRKNDKFILCDALTVDYNELLDNNFDGATTIDYLQCDIEPSVNTLTALKLLPHDRYRFRAITFETDLYTGGKAFSVREESRSFLTNLGYELIVGDVVVGNSNPFEDWWVDLNLVNRDVALNIKECAKRTQRPVELLLTK
jgi:hypothetical protein